MRKPTTCSTKDAPGGDACQLVRGHIGPHDWQGGRPAGERHAKDFFGVSLYIGDRVAAMVPRYRCLGAADVVAITPKRIRVRWVMAVSSRDLAGDIFTTEDSMVVKARRQGP